jgi:uncharacterized protein (TIGR02996 family)
MSDRAALLAAIIAHPDEDTPRLALADWLDEHGDSKRAAHIRSQIEYHRLTTADTATTAVEEFLTRLYEESLDRVDWTAVDADLGAGVAARKANEKRSFKLNQKAEGVPAVKGASFDNNARGFFDTVTVEDATAFLKHADAVFRAAPITCVNFQELTGEQAAEFAASGHLARLRELSLHDRIEPDAIRALGTHKDAAAVRTLEIHYDGDEAITAVEALAAGKYWTGVESLEVSDLCEGEEPPEDGQMANLFARPQFRKLRALRAWGSNADAAAARAIIKNMSELREVDLSLNPLADGERAFAAAKNLRHLRVLDLSACDLEGGDPAALITTANLPNLTVLRLDNNELSGPNPKVLAKSGRGPGLRVLDLGSAQFTEPGIEALVKCPAVRGVWYLSFVAANIGDDHLERFARHAAFERLTYLDLSINDFTARGAQALAAWPGAASLQWLDVSNNALGAAGAKALAASPHLAGLKYLSATGRGTAALKKRFKKVFA